MSAGRRAAPALRGVRTTLLLGEPGSCDRLLAGWLAQRPPGESWSVLDNRPLADADPALPVPAAPATDPTSQVRLTRLTGGCLCCAGVNLRVTLTRLLRVERPQRLFILPPPEAELRSLLRQLGDNWLLPVLALRAVIGVLDPEHWVALAEPARQELLERLAGADLLVLASDPGAIAGIPAWVGWQAAHPGIRLLKLPPDPPPLQWLDEAPTPRPRTFRTE